jgi:hypothetical protein
MPVRGVTFYVHQRTGFRAFAISNLDELFVETGN